MSTAMYTAEESTHLRRLCLEQDFMPWIQRAFNDHPNLQSAVLQVAQYWDDNADDEVHFHILFSTLTTPDLAAALACMNVDGDDLDLRNGLRRSQQWQLQHDYASEIYWDSMRQAVYLFAAYCKEDCHQDMDFGAAYSPYAVFRRHGDSVGVEVVGSMLRPWLDGIRVE